MNTLFHDLRYAARMLRSKPGFTAVAIITLSLGIGANTAIFSVVNAVLLRPLPFPKPENIVLLKDDLPGTHAEDVGVSVDELKDLQERSGVFEEVSALWPIDANLTGSDRPERIEVLAVSPNYFSLLGASAKLGRVFDPQDRTTGFAEGVVISDGLWRRLFASDPNVLGRKVYMDSDSYTVVGVMPPGFRHPGKTLRNDVEMWATAGFTSNPFPSPPVRKQRMLPGAIGRIKPEFTVQQAQAKLDAFVANLRQEFPNDYPAQQGWTVKLMPARETLVGNVQSTLLVLLGAVGLVLLIGCVNIANLLLARSSARQREMAIRLALGAGRTRLVLQMLTESLLLSFIGGAVALFIVVTLKNVLLRLVPADTPRLSEVGVNAGVLVFVFLISTLTGLLFGLIPALQASRPDLVGNLKEGSQGGGSGARHHTFRSGLVVVEFALSLMLMIAAGLLLRSFGRLMEVNPGFDSNNVLLARIWLPVPNNPDKDPYRPQAKRAGFIKEVLRRTSGLPGVQYAAISGGGGVPLLDQNKPGVFSIEDQPATDGSLQLTKFSAVSPDYFRVLGAPLVRGRFFEAGDDEQAARVVLIDEALAQRFFPNVDPLGRHIKPGPRENKAPWMTIVGVVGNIKTDGFDKPDTPHLYLPIIQSPGYSMAVYVRTQGNPSGLSQALRQQVQGVDPNLPLFGEQTMEDLVSASLAQRRFAMQVVALFGVLALFLAGIGIYGVMAYSVTQRTREIGIRLALGASTGDILRWLLGRGMRLTLIGVAAGLLGALAVGRLLRGLLFGVAPTDVITYAGITLLLAIVALLACYIPARRATKVDPLVALRYE
jgi:predicted permease